MTMTTLLICGIRDEQQRRVILAAAHTHRVLRNDVRSATAGDWESIAVNCPRNGLAGDLSSSTGIQYIYK
jgi:hypothetical protein